ncbi:MAG TPA: hypothetical protein VGN23_13320 [Verrucomicrobiae bacterium]|jgi:hypothetical protein
MARHIEYLEELQNAVRFKHRCSAAHAESVFVHERTNAGETVWKGYVEVFDLTGHEEAKKCYAWLNRKANGLKILTVMGNQLIDSAQKAVQAAIFMGVQPAFTTLELLRFLDFQLQQAKGILQETQINSEDLDAAIQAAQQIQDNIQKGTIGTFADKSVTIPVLPKDLEKGY